MIELIIALLVIYAWSLNGLMDRIKFHWHKSPKWMKKRPNFWGPDSWKNKWKLNNDGAIIYDEKGKKVPRFFLSNSVLVSVTNGWHMLKEIMIQFLCIALWLAYDLESYLLWPYFRLCFGLGFKLTYK